MGQLLSLIGSPAGSLGLGLVQSLLQGMQGRRARAANEERYGEARGLLLGSPRRMSGAESIINQGYDQIIPQQQANSATAETDSAATTAELLRMLGIESDRAIGQNTANSQQLEAEFKDLQGSIGAQLADRRGQAMARFKDLSGAARARLDQKLGESKAAGQARLASSGLANTSGAVTIGQGADRDNAQALAEYDEDLAGRELGLDLQLSGQEIDANERYGAAFNTMRQGNLRGSESLIGSLNAGTIGATDQGRRAIDAIRSGGLAEGLALLERSTGGRADANNQATRDLVNLISGRTDAYPDQGSFLSSLSNLGSTAGYAQMLQANQPSGFEQFLGAGGAGLPFQIGGLAALGAGNPALALPLLFGGGLAGSYGSLAG